MFYKYRGVSLLLFALQLRIISLLQNVCGLGIGLACKARATIDNSGITLAVLLSISFYPIAVRICARGDVCSLANLERCIAAVATARE